MDEQKLSIITEKARASPTTFMKYANQGISHSLLEGKDKGTFVRLLRDLGDLHSRTLRDLGDLHSRTEMQIETSSSKVDNLYGMLRTIHATLLLISRRAR